MLCLIHRGGMRSRRANGTILSAATPQGQNCGVSPNVASLTASLAVASGAVAQTSISYWEKEKAWAVGAGFCRDSFG